MMKQIYGIDMEETQRSKLLADIPTVDTVVTMGCNVQCPFLPCKHREDWGLTTQVARMMWSLKKQYISLSLRFLDLKCHMENGL